MRGNENTELASTSSIWKTTKQRSSTNSNSEGPETVSDNFFGPGTQLRCFPTHFNQWVPTGSAAL